EQGHAVPTTVIGVPDIAALQSVLNISIDNPAPAFGAGDAIMPLVNNATGASFTFANNTVRLSQTDAEGNPSQHPVDLHVEQRDYKRSAQNNEAVAFVNTALFDDGTFKADGNAMLIKLNV
ncbi:peptide ABC transporter permease, partial [Salmonella enterica subsp. enterica serovar Enteritidis]|nr:peptide ABC transporter permease [Salmonella enterica subsp. enterica serovar Enteritidis]